MNTGLIHLYIGDGKGKTTAAAGLAARAAGNGKCVVFGQFLKGRRTGEVVSLERLGVRVIRSATDPGFSWNMNEQQKEGFKAEQGRLFADMMEALGDEKGIDLLVMDEALDALAMGLLEEGTFRDAIVNKADGLEIVCTGRTAPDWLIEKADYVTEMKKLKHPFDRGIKARAAIEY